MKMKKAIVLLLGFLAIGYFTQAQKIGYFNSNEVLKNNAEVKKIDSQVNAYLEVLKAGYTVLQDEVTEKTAKLKDTTLTPAKKSVLNDDITSLTQRINSYQSDATQKLTQRRNELFNPLSKKLYEIVSTLALEGKYNTIFDIASTTLYYSDKSGDLTDKIKAKLK
jgi:outer membrane protein